MVRRSLSRNFCTLNGTSSDSTTPTTIVSSSPTTTAVPFQVPTISRLYLNGPSEISLGQDVVYTVDFTITTGTFIQTILTDIIR